MPNNKKNTLKSIRESQRSYLNRDFDSFRASLTSYASTFFSDKISDFSQNGLAGMLIELLLYRPSISRVRSHRGSWNK